MSRLPWDDVPAHVRAAVEAELGAPVVTALSQPEGFSPGTAARLVTATGGRAFVKVVGAALNPDSPELYRREAVTAAALPATAPVPALRWSYDDGDWVALLFDDVDGRHPQLPWDPAELRRVMTALAELHGALSPTPVAAPTVEERHGDIMRCWRRLLERPHLHDRLDAWSLRHLDELAALETRWASDVGGDTLLHTDLRADNVLLTASGVVFVDWAHACVGAPWFDLAVMAPCLAMQGGPEPARLLATAPAPYGVPADGGLAVAAGLAGYFTYASLRPAPQGIPTVRAFQAAQGVAARAWVADLTGWAR